MVTRCGVRYGITAWASWRDPDLARSTHAVQFTKHLIPGQVWTLEHHFFELAPWGTKDDFHDVCSLLVDVRACGLGMEKFRCILNATRSRHGGDKTKLPQMM